MSKFNYNAPPPMRSIGPPRRVSESAALQKIESYLERATGISTSTARQPDGLQHTSTIEPTSPPKPYLHPDCVFTHAGPSLEGRPASGGRVFDQLRRMAAGLRGETLGGDINLLFGSEETDQKTSQQTGQNNEDSHLRFGSMDASGNAANTSSLPAGDDAKLDALIEGPTIPYDEEDDSYDGVYSMLAPEKKSETAQAKSDNQQMLEQSERRVVGGEIGARGDVVGKKRELPDIQDTASEAQRESSEDNDNDSNTKIGRKHREKSKTREQKREKKRRRKEKKQIRRNREARKAETER